MSDAIDVAIVGAGPYGLSVAAHLRAAGVNFRQFGRPMRLWREAMPAGMYLKSQGFASNLSDPAGSHTLEAYCAKTGHPYASYGWPVPLDTFIGYGEWFADELAPGLEQVLVTDIAQHRGGGYDVTLDNGEVLLARNVVVAAGVEHFPRMPGLLAQLPPELCTHASAHTDLGVFSGQRVIVVGAGQSALESAALLHEQGAAVQLVARAADVKWNGTPLAPDRPLTQRMREPEAGLGSGWTTWFYSRHPGLFRHLPQSVRVSRARRALGPAGASWLRSRVEGQFPVLTQHAIASIAERGDGARLSLRGPGGSITEVAADHVIAGSGYKPDLTRLSFLGSQLRSRLKTVDATAAVGADYESSARGLYFIGPAVAPSLGPAMRFVYGCDHAATAVGRRLAATARDHAPAAMAAAR